MPNVDLDFLYTEEMTDASATVTRIVDVAAMEDIVVDITTDKGTTVTITPVLSKTNDSILGRISDTLTISDSGGTDRAIYSKIAAPRAKVIVTKTEAGTTSGFQLVISGIKDAIR